MTRQKYFGREKRDDLSKAFDILINFFKLEMKKLIDQNQFESFSQLKSNFDQLLDLQRKIFAFPFDKNLKREVIKREKIEFEKKASGVDATFPKRRGRKPKEKDYKPINDYRFPILKILVDANGKAAVKDILKKLEEMFKDEFTEKDRSVLRANKEILWRHNAKICRTLMIRDGLLADNAPWGYWVLTAKGREEYEKFFSSEK